MPPSPSNPSTPNEPQGWFLKIDDGSVFGPVDPKDLRSWAEQGRIAPGNLVSQDQKDWKAAELIPELEMFWMVELVDGTFFGPLNLCALADLIQAQVLATGNTEDRLLVPRTAYAAALGALESYVSGAKQRLDRAQGALTRLADPARKTLLTEPQKTRLNTPTPASLTTERETAAGHEKALDEAQWALEQAQRKRDLAQVKEAAGAGAPGALAAAEADLVTRAATKTAADTAYPPSERTLLSEWEAAIPDAIWADLADYLDARTSLTDLAGTPTGTLETTLGTAEETLVHDLVALGKEQAARDLYAAELAGRTAAAEFAAGAAGRIVFSALRGDA